MMNQTPASTHASTHLANHFNHNVSTDVPSTLSSHLDDKHIVRVQDLRTYFRADGKIVKSVDGVDFALERGKTLAIVGESGSGKSVTSLSMMGLLPSNGWVEGGQIDFRDRQGQVHDLTRASQQTMRRIRGKEIAMIFQEPMSSLNPVFTIGQQIAESLVLHLGQTQAQALAQAKRLCHQVAPLPRVAPMRHPHASNKCPRSPHSPPNKPAAASAGANWSYPHEYP